MKKVLILLATCAFAANSSALMAAEKSSHSVSANVTLATDYVFRGVSQTNGDPAIQGGFDYNHAKGFYAGLWASNVEFNENAALAPTAAVNEATLELDLYAGYGGSFGKNHSYDLGLLYYAYPGSENSLNYDFFEAYGGVDFSLGSKTTLGLKLSYSPEFFGETGEATYLEANVNFAISDNFGIGLHYGSQKIDVGDDYTDWKVSLAGSGAGFDLELAYTDTDIDNSTIADDRVVFSISRSM
ncbi:TorF family putative porin [Pseudomonadota bacterium]